MNLYIYTYNNSPIVCTYNIYTVNTLIFIQHINKYINTLYKDLIGEK